MSAHEDSRLVDECIELRQIIARLATENRDLRQELLALQECQDRLKERWAQEMAERAREFMRAEVGPQGPGGGE